jgi:predicted nucleic acid-binding Zn ribbon protein
MADRYPRKKGGDPLSPLPAGIRSVGSSLGDVANRLGLAAPGTLHQIFSQWAELVGEPLATHVKPTSMRDGVLRLRADEPAWAAQVGYLGTDLMARINDRLGTVVVVELAVSVRGVRPSARNRGSGF